MIARVWTGLVARIDRDTYVAYVETTGVAAYRQTPGCVLATILTRDLDGDRSEVTAFSIWQDETSLAGSPDTTSTRWSVIPKMTGTCWTSPSCGITRWRAHRTHTTKENPMTDYDHDEVARAFSGHRFRDAFDHLDEHVVWTLVGEGRIQGRDAVITACQATSTENANVETSWLRFVSTGDGDIVAVDAVGRYAGPDGVSTVSSCDIYEFVDGTIRAITSYAVELDSDDPSAATGTG